MLAMLTARQRFALISSLLLTYLLLASELSFWESASFGFSLFAMLTFLHELGRSIAIRELIVLVSTVTMVFSPTMTLLSHPEQMILPSNEYLSYGLPATIAFSIGILLRLYELTPHKTLLESIKIYLADKQKTIPVLFVLGLIGTVLVDFMPVEIRAVVYLFATCLFTSVLYGHYSGGTSKKVTLVIAAAVLLFNTIQQGMFGTMLHFVTLYFCIVLVTRKNVIKLHYNRMKTWGDTITERKADPTLMLGLVIQRLNDTDFLFGSDHLAATNNRTNQGALISETMYYVPRVEPYANGEILLHFVYPFIPRFLWNNKPITGGLANVERYTQFVHMGTSSYNISPLGEGYANFGRVGGIVFMFFFGLLFNLCFHKIIKIAESKPSILLWIPSLFVGCLTLETDVLTVWGSFAIMATFLFIFWVTTKRLAIHL
jgi:hypothetical protein